MYKVDVSVLPNWLKMIDSKTYPGSVADLEIIHRMKEDPIPETMKKPDKNGISDYGLHSEEYPAHCDFLW